MAAFNNYFPASYAHFYPQTQNYMPAQNVQQNANNGLVWVQGLEGAKAHFVPAGASALLMDSESERFYIKSSDASGMPLPLRVFEFREITDAPAKAPVPDMSGYVTREEFEQYKQSMSGKAAKLTDE